MHHIYIFQIVKSHASYSLKHQKYKKKKFHLERYDTILRYSHTIRVALHVFHVEPFFEKDSIILKLKGDSKDEISVIDIFVNLTPNIPKILNNHIQLIGKYDNYER